MAHLMVVKRILRYLKETQYFGFCYLSTSSKSLYGFNDADCAGCPTTRRITMGYCVFLRANYIFWPLKKQANIACLSTKAEYCSLTFFVAKF